MKNGIIIKQRSFTNDKKENIAFCGITLYIDGEYVRVTPVKEDKRVFNMICKNSGFVVGSVDNLAEVDTDLARVIGD